MNIVSFIKAYKNISKLKTSAVKVSNLETKKEPAFADSFHIVY